MVLNRGLWLLLLGLVSSAGGLYGQDANIEACPDDRLRGDLGYDGYFCVACTIHREDDFIEFEAEPRINHVDPEGPAAGRLEPGDQLVAVDGILITRRAAALRIATVEPGESVVVTVRRPEGLVDVRVTAGAECAERARRAGWMESYREPPRDRPERNREAEDRPDVNREADAGERRRQRGSLGFGVRCFAACTVRVDADGAAVWSFAEEPTIAELAPDGAARTAGVAEGDLLVSIDGLEITSPAAGRRLGALAPWDRVTLAVRRDGRVLEFELVAR